MRSSIAVAALLAFAATGLISPATAALVLDWPTGVHVWEADTPRPIHWHSPDGWTGNVKLELSTDGGSTWPEMITPSHPSTPSPYWWTVTDTPSSDCFIRVSDVLGVGGSDTNNDPFTITSNPFIKVDVPNGGQSWEADEPRQIVWHTHIFTGDVNIDLSTDGGATYPHPIAANVPTPLSHTGTSYEWDVFDLPSSQCRIKVSDAADARLFDVSDANFTLTSNPTITIDNPNGGEELGVGWPWPIVWHSHIFTGLVDIDLSTDGGLSWASIAMDVASPDTGVPLEYWWTVPDTPSQHCLIRISDAAGVGPTDITDATFTIVPEPATMGLLALGGLGLLRRRRRA